MPPSDNAARRIHTTAMVHAEHDRHAPAVVTEQEERQRPQQVKLLFNPQ